MGGWQIDDAPAPIGRVAVITGANSGLGYETARALRSRGAQVVMACRSQDKATAAAARMAADGPGLDPEIIQLDLDDLHSVRHAAEEMTSRHESIDILINNAGVMGLRGPDGPERQLWANHLGHVALTAALLGSIERAGGRIVSVSSNLHRRGKLRVDQPLDLIGQKPMTAYGSTKLANLLFCFEGDRRLRAARSAASFRAAHPGWSRSELAGKGPVSDSGALSKRVGAFVGSHFGQRTENGAMPSLRAALDPAIPPGAYVGPSGLGELWGPPEPVNASKAATDPVLAAALFDESLQWVGASWPSP